MDSRRPVSSADSYALLVENQHPKTLVSEPVDASPDAMAPLVRSVSDYASKKQANRRCSAPDYVNLRRFQHHPQYVNIKTLDFNRLSLSENSELNETSSRVGNSDCGIPGCRCGVKKGCRPEGHVPNRTHALFPLVLEDVDGNPLGNPDANAVRSIPEPPELIKEALSIDGYDGGRFSRSSTLSSYSGGRSSPEAYSEASGKQPFPIPQNTHKPIKTKSNDSGMISDLSSSNSDFSSYYDSPPMVQHFQHHYSKHHRSGRERSRTIQYVVIHHCACDGNSAKHRETRGGIANGSSRNFSDENNDDFDDYCAVSTNIALTPVPPARHHHYQRHSKSAIKPETLSYCRIDAEKTLALQELRRRQSSRSGSLANGGSLGSVEEEVEAKDLIKISRELVDGGVVVEGDPHKPGFGIGPFRNLPTNRRHSAACFSGHQDHQLQHQFSYRQRHWSNRQDIMMPIEDAEEIVRMGGGVMMRSSDTRYSQPQLVALQDDVFVEGSRSLAGTPIVKGKKCPGGSRCKFFQAKRESLPLGSPSPADSLFQENSDVVCDKKNLGRRQSDSNFCNGPPLKWVSPILLKNGGIKLFKGVRRRNSEDVLGGQVASGGLGCERVEKESLKKSGRISMSLKHLFHRK